MNEIERRTLLGAAGIGALAALGKAGPLNPPPGPVAPTGRTLDEVFDKVAALAPGGRTVDEVYDRVAAIGFSDGRIPLTLGVIDQPGSYVLMQPLEHLNITASGVTLDLNGHSVTSGLEIPMCVAISGNNVLLRNGSVNGGSVGVFLNGTTGVIVEDVRVHGAKFIGIYAANGGPSAPSSATLIRRCRVTGTGAGVYSGGGLYSGVNLYGDSSIIEDTLVSQMTPGAGGAGGPDGLGLIGFQVEGRANLIRRCTAAQAPGVTGRGFAFFSPSTPPDSIYSGNTAIGYSTKYSNAGGFTDGGGNV